MIKHLRAVTVCIGDKIIESANRSDGSALLNLLCTILDEKMSADEKEQILENEFSIESSKELKEGFEIMCNLSYAIQEKAEVEGQNKGIEKGAMLMGKLATLLAKQGRISDIERATSDAKFREQLYKEFNLV